MVGIYIYDSRFSNNPHLTEPPETWHESICAAIDSKVFEVMLG